MLIQLFPLALYRGKIDLDKKYKEELIKYVLQDEKNNQKIKEELSKDRNQNPTFLGDEMGDAFLHNNEIFEKLFFKIEEEIKKYLMHLGFDCNSINLYFLRSWATVSRKGQQIHWHDHKQSHISFAYYLNFPQNSGNLEFMNDGKMSEIISGSFSHINFRKIVFKESNMLNAPYATLPVMEDDIFIFPSKNLHRTQIGTNSEPRISMSADVIITLKEGQKNAEHGVPEIKHWKKFGR